MQIEDQDQLLPDIIEDQPDQIPDIMEDHPGQLLPDVMEDRLDQLLPDFMEDRPNQLLPHIMEDLYRMLDIDDLYPEVSDHIPFTRKQHIVNLAYKVNNIWGERATITMDFTNKHQLFWRSYEGDVHPISNGTFIPPSASIVIPHTRVRHGQDAKFLWSAIQRHSFIRTLLSSFELKSLDEFSKLETEISLCLLNAVSTANDQGYSGIHVDMVLEVETVDTFDEEEVALATSTVASAAFRSVIEALPSHEFDDGGSSNNCIFCLVEYSPGVIVTRLPCSHDFHKLCIGRWLNVNNSCPICRSPISDML